MKRLEMIAMMISMANFCICSVITGNLVLYIEYNMTCKAEWAL